MGSILTFVLGNKTLILSVILASVIAGMAAHITKLKSDVVKLDAEVTVLSTKFQVSQASVKTLQDEITVQNGAITKMKTDEEDKYKAYVIEIGKAKKISNGFKQQATDLMNRKVPENVDICAATDQLINEEIQNGKK